MAVGKSKVKGGQKTKDAPKKDAPKEVAKKPDSTSWKIRVSK